MTREVEELALKLAFETGSFSKQISAINKAIKNSEREFKTASKGVNGFEQTFTGLNTKIQSQTKQLDLYNTKLEKQQNEYNKLSEKVSKQKEELDRLEQTQGKSSTAWIKQAELVQKNSEKLARLETDIDNTKSNINRLSNALAESQEAFNNLGQKTETLDDKLEKIQRDSELAKSEFNRLGTELQQTGNFFQRLENDMNSLRSEIESNNQKIQAYENEINGLNTKLESNRQEHNRLKTEIQQVETELNQAKSEYGENSREAQQLSTKLAGLKDDFNRVDNEIDQVTSELNQLQTELNNTQADTNRLSDELESMPFDEIGGKLGEAAEKMQAFSLAFGGIATASIAAGGEASNAMGKIKGGLGETTEEAEKTFESIQNLAKKGFNFDEAVEALILVKQTMSDVLQPSEMESFTADVMALSSTFEVDFNEVIKTSSTMMKNFGIDGEEALDIIAYGFQNGLNYSDDWIDTLWEYSNQFSGLGFTAEQTLAIIKNGMEEGTFNTDKLADMIKEANIRLKEMGKDQQEAVKSLGLSTTEVQKNIATGGETASNQMIQLAQKVMEIKDPIEQNTVATAIFGTMFEDLGINGVAALAGLGNETIDTKGAIDGVRQAFEETFGAEMAAVINSLKEPLMQLGEAMMPIIENAADLIGKFAEWFSSLDEGTLTSIGNFVLIAAAISPVLGAISSLVSFGGSLSLVLGAGGLTGTVGGLISALGFLAGPVGIGLAVAALLGFMSTIGNSESALSFLQDKFGSLGTVVGGICEFIAGIWNLTFDNMVAKATLGLDLIAAVIDGPGGATVKDAWSKYTSTLQKNNDNAWNNLTLTTTRELSQQKNSVDKNTKEAAKAMDKNTKAGADAVSKNMQSTSKVVLDESGKIPKDVKSNMDASVQAMKQAGSDIYNGMNTSFSKLATNGKQHFTDLYKGTKTSSEKMASSAKSAATDMYKGVTNSTSKMADKAISDWNRIRNAYSRKITGTVTTYKNTVINPTKKASKAALFSTQNFDIQPMALTESIDIQPYALDGSYYSRNTPESVALTNTTEKINKKDSNNTTNVYANINFSDIKINTEQDMKKLASIINKELAKIQSKANRTKGGGSVVS